MLSNACAVWLVFLILSPFSAPFSTCDMATFFTSAVRHNALAPAPSELAGVLDHASAHAMPASRLSHRHDMAAAASFLPVGLARDMRTRPSPGVGTVTPLDVRIVSPLRI